MKTYARSFIVLPEFPLRGERSRFHYGWFRFTVIFADEIERAVHIKLMWSKYAQLLINKSQNLNTRTAEVSKVHGPRQAARIIRTFHNVSAIVEVN